MAVGNYIWPFPDEESMGSLDMAVDAATDMMDVLGMPVISGKDSLSSTYRGKDGAVIKIPPVYTQSIFGRIPDVEKTMTSDIKKPGESHLYLVGLPSSGMAGSAYYDIAGGESGEIPKVNTPTLKPTLEKIHGAIKSGQVLACHDVSEGGLVTAVAEMCFGSNSGATINIPQDEDFETFLFNETAGCFVVEVADTVAADAAFDGVPYKRIGSTSNEGVLKVREGDWRTLFETSTIELKDSWQARMKGIFH